MDEQMRNEVLNTVKRGMNLARFQGIQYAKVIVENLLTVADVYYKQEEKKLEGDKIRGAIWEGYTLALKTVLEDLDEHTPKMVDMKDVADEQARIRELHAARKPDSAA